MDGGFLNTAVYRMNYLEAIASLHLVRCLCPRSRSSDLDPMLSSKVLYSISMSEMAKGEEGDGAFINSLPLEREIVFLVFFLFRRQKWTHTDLSSSDTFDDDSASNGSGYVTFLSFFTSPPLAFLPKVYPFGSDGPFAPAWGRFNLSTSVLMTKSEWDVWLKLFISMVSSPASLGGLYLSRSSPGSGSMHLLCLN